MHTRSVGLPCPRRPSADSRIWPQVRRSDTTDADTRRNESGCRRVGPGPPRWGRAAAVLDPVLSVARSAASRLPAVLRLQLLRREARWFVATARAASASSTSFARTARASLWFGTQRGIPSSRSLSLLTFDVDGNCSRSYERAEHFFHQGSPDILLRTTEIGVWIWAIWDRAKRCRRPPAFDGPGARPTVTSQRCGRSALVCRRWKAASTPRSADPPSYDHGPIPAAPASLCRGVCPRQGRRSSSRSSPIRYRYVGITPLLTTDKTYVRSYHFVMCVPPDPAAQLGRALVRRRPDEHRLGTSGSRSMTRTSGNGPGCTLMRGMA